jgi:hypothetical protein
VNRWQSFPGGACFRGVPGRSCQPIQALVAALPCFAMVCPEFYLSRFGTIAAR